MRLLFTFFSKEIDYALCWTLLHSVWQIVVIALLLSLLLVLLKRNSAGLRYIICNIFLWLVVMASFATFIYYHQRSEKLFNVVYVPVRVSVQPADKVLAANTIAEKNPDPSVITDKAQSPWTAFNQYFNRHLPAIVLFWTLGVCFFIIRLLSGLSYISYLKKRQSYPPPDKWQRIVQSLSAKAGCRRPLLLKESGIAVTPMVVGFLKPVILFPVGMLNNLTYEEAEGILAHEIAHIIRNDYFINIIQSIIEAVYYYHPAAWWMSSMIRNERESACDEIAVRMTGNSLNYAKALIAVEQLRVAQPRTALAFAGKGKSQLRTRIERILNISNSKNNSMSKIIAVSLIFALFTTLAVSQNSKKVKMPDVPVGSRLYENNIASGLSGIWQASVEGETVCVTFSSGIKGEMWLTKECFDKKEFSALPSEESDFNLSREAGSIKFTGKFKGKEGSGQYSFSANESFTAFLKDQGVGEIKEEILLHAFFNNINSKMILLLKKSETSGISKYQFRDMALFGITPADAQAYISLMEERKYNGNKIDKMIELKIHDVDIDYVNGISKQGFTGLRVDELLQAKVHGLEPGFIDSVKKAGYPDITIGLLTEFKNFEVDIAYINALNKANKGKLSPAEIIDAKIHDVDPSGFKGEKNGGTSFSDSKNFALFDITTEYVDAMNSLGFGKLTNAMIIKAKIHDLDPAYAGAILKTGIKDIGFDEILKCKLFEVDAAFINGLREMGIGELTTQKAINYKIHDISPEFIKGFNTLFAKKISEDELMDLRMHEVTPAFVEGFTKEGYKDISVAKAINLRIHEVTPELAAYLKKEKAVTGSDIDEVIDYKIHRDK